jgi:hypothetical protein
MPQSIIHSAIIFLAMVWSKRVFEKFSHNSYTIRVLVILPIIGSKSYPARLLGVVFKHPPRSDIGDLPWSEASHLAQFLKWAGFDEYRRHAATDDEAYGMN